MDLFFFFPFGASRKRWLSLPESCESRRGSWCRFRTRLLGIEGRWVERCLSMFLPTSTSTWSSTSSPCLTLARKRLCSSLPSNVLTRSCGRSWISTFWGQAYRVGRVLIWFCCLSDWCLFFWWIPLAGENISPGLVPLKQLQLQDAASYTFRWKLTTSVSSFDGQTWQRLWPCKMYDFRVRSLCRFRQQEANPNNASYSTNATMLLGCESLATSTP